MALGIIYSNPGLPVIYTLDSDPTVFAGWGGTNAESQSLLLRTDTNTIYRKSGSTSTAWTLTAVSSAGLAIQNGGVPIAGNPHDTLNMGTGLIASDSGGGVAALAIQAPTYRTSAISTTLLPTDQLLVFIGNATAVTVTLSAAATVIAGKRFTIKDGSGTAANRPITINRAGADTIDGSTSATVQIPFGSLDLVSDGVSAWQIV